LSPQSRIRKQVLSLEEIQQKLKHKMPELAKLYRVKYLGIFGSYVRGEASKTRDLDLLVEFEEAPTLVEHIRMERLLSEELRHQSGSGHEENPQAPYRKANPGRGGAGMKAGRNRGPKTENYDYS
jgi:predicted nucleotidyltransferase